jgi:hypothetical protein
MGWVYLDDRFPEHPKVLAAGDEAAWLFVCGVAYTNRGAGDGMIPKNAVGRLTGLRKPMQLAARLVDVGLWHDKDDCYAIHDYGFWNAQAMARRAKARNAANARWSKPSDAPSNAQALREHPPSNATAMQYPKPQAPSVSVLPETHTGIDERPPDSDQPPAKPLTAEAQALADRWLGVLAKPSPYDRCEAEQWVPHLLEYVDSHVIDEAIGRAAEQQPPPRKTSYLVAACRAAVAPWGITIPDLPKDRAR